MKLRKLKSIKEASDRDMLEYIFASQLHILRRLDFLENKLTKSEIRSHFQATKEMINKVDSSLDRINDYLELEDLEKGELNL
ncbi:hypothetical protein [Leeuwenhoekiella parthenopeia]|uniref:Uncharacterized protein n=1 Tax=Leeuwenhoekiella parthenopeia TaxID=2890320 RepID=A0ABS8GSJ8_9FLAO|nr:hypothetical protein [Leeuwenhoekiella parthenopeia]MCC4212955.1 hypothetical protein [Leeuwenhoekiella parthenopeia]